MSTHEKQPEVPADERAVTSEPIEMDDGSTVVIQQQNVGPANQVGGGEFKNVGTDRPPEKIALEQLELERDAPVDSGQDVEHPPTDDAASQ